MVIRARICNPRSDSNGGVRTARSSPPPSRSKRSAALAGRAGARTRRPPPAAARNAWTRPSGGGRPADLVERRETRELVRRCIDRLPDAYRTVLLLRDVEELDTDETADALGTTASAVKTRLHRARQALRPPVRQLPGCAVRPARLRGISSRGPDRARSVRCRRLRAG